MSLVSLARLLSVAIVIAAASSLAAPQALAEGTTAKQNRVVLQVSDNNKAYIEQASDASRVTIYQGLEQPVQGQYGYDLALGGNNTADVKQNAGADGSRADVIQGGSDHIALVTQSGAGSESYLNQMGTNNSGTVTQEGDDNYSSVIQGGTGNTATVGQYSDGNISSVMQSGSGNTATVTQGTH